MAASGINDRTRIALDKLLDQSFARAGIKPQLVSGEMLNFALTDLDLLLKNMSATGVQLWCYERIVVPPIVGARKLPMPEGTDDIDHASIRRQNVLPPLSLITNAVDVTALMGAAGYPAPATYSSLIYTFQTAALGGEYDMELAFLTSKSRSLAVSYSSDGTTYSAQTLLGDATINNVLSVSSNAMTFTLNVPKGTVAIKLDDVSYTGALPLDPLNFKVVRGGSETPLVQIGEGAYQNLGDATSDQTPYQYFVDRNVDVLNMMLFPIFGLNSSINKDLVIWRKRHIMDVGRVTNTLDLPSRWMEPLVWHMAWRVAVREPDATKGIWTSLKNVADEMETKTRETERVQGKINVRFRT